MIIDNVEAYEKWKWEWTRLMKLAEKIANEKWANRIELWAYPQDEYTDSARLLEFYENLGYKINEESSFEWVPYYDMVKYL